MAIVVSVSIKRLPHAADLPLPAYQTSQSAGMDLCAAITADDVVMAKTAHHHVIAPDFLHNFFSFEDFVGIGGQQIQ